VLFFLCGEGFQNINNRGSKLILENIMSQITNISARELLLEDLVRIQRKVNNFVRPTDEHLSEVLESLILIPINRIMSGEVLISHVSDLEDEVLAMTDEEAQEYLKRHNIDTTETKLMILKMIKEAKEKKDML